MGRKMELTERLLAEGFEQVMFCADAATGLRSIIAIHDTTLGPALGGVRMWPYPDEQAALEDCLRLARAMTRKSAAAGLDLGGAKSVVIGDPATKTPDLMRAHGRFIQSLGGRYIPGIDVGTEAQDMAAIAMEAQTVTCTDGDPSYFTALGAFSGIVAALRHLDGTESLAGRTVAVQGAGHVGSHLGRLLAAADAKVMVSDIDRARAQALADELGVIVVDPDELVATECDVLAPCALGGVLNARTIPSLRCRVVAGAANNVLADESLAAVLAESGILFIPEFLLSAGGVI